METGGAQQAPTDLKATEEHKDQGRKQNWHERWQEMTKRPWANRVGLTSSNKIYERIGRTLNGKMGKGPAECYQPSFEFLLCSGPGLATKISNKKTFDHGIHLSLDRGTSPYCWPAAGS